MDSDIEKQCSRKYRTVNNMALRLDHKTTKQKTLSRVCDITHTKIEQLSYNSAEYAKNK